MHSIINRLYNFIVRLISLLEEELDINSKTTQSKMTKKNITDCLQKLVSLTTQLNKLSLEQKIDSEKILDDNDQQIINNFLAKYK
ncbi:hypothetical protein [Rickettsia endosymbiont of Cardiosporidium cionae]|uniref:hypothetical protein n=1 Tax=Rickettsia endosymbiont of Cardiosporidium cionae TaxID=2777155 RepID=UPI0018941386|nr:hypothetical protein [Rickettsia endosymbiont of Cardiosporidium cionae]KAF8818500.1 hypothetical protein IHI24_000594 [Rickettsia endosymbiont of Cardiosporidium cionae]